MFYFSLLVLTLFIYIAVNEALRPKFLDLKEGAIVVSLSPFVSSLNARVTERNVSCLFSTIYNLLINAFILFRLMILAQSLR